MRNILLRNVWFVYWSNERFRHIFWCFYFWLIRFKTCCCSYNRCWFMLNWFHWHIWIIFWFIINRNSNFYIWLIPIRWLNLRFILSHRVTCGVKLCLNIRHRNILSCCCSWIIIWCRLIILWFTLIRILRLMFDNMFNFFIRLWKVRALIPISSLCWMGLNVYWRRYCCNNFRIF